MWSSGIGTDVWEMFCACIVGDLDTVKALVERDPSLIRSHYEYRTPLSFAVRENQLAVAEYLLDHGAAAVMLGDPVEMARDRGHTAMVDLLERKMRTVHGASPEGEPIAAAIRSRDLVTVRRLLDERPNLIEARDERFNQPIHWAVMTRQLDMIDEVLRRGADINAQRADGARPIHLTDGDYHYRGWRDVPPDVKATPDDVYRHLVARGADVDLGMAAFKGDVDRVKKLLAADPSLANRTSDYGSYYIGCGAPIKNAAAGGHIEIVKLLLAHGADPNLPEEGIAPQGHALYSAVSNGYYDIARLLLEHGAYPNPQVESSADAVWIAIRNGDTRMLELLGSFGATMHTAIRLDGKISYADLVAWGIERPVEMLAYYGDVEAAAALFATDPSLADDPKALANAASNAHESFVQLMLELHPELPHKVTVSKPREMAELLFARGMDANRPNWLRKTPLHDFAGSGDIESAALFLDHGADLRARDEEQCSTALGWAAMNGQTRMVEFLLRRGGGANPDESDGPEWATPLAWAMRRGHHDVVSLLTDYKSHGAPAARSLAEHDARATDLADAYGGDEGALIRIMEHFRLQRPLTWDHPPHHVRVERLRKAVNEQLGRSHRAAGESLSRDDARFLIARAEGCASWSELVEGTRRESRASDH
jgi:ankyrin repeat protein